MTQTTEQMSELTAKDLKGFDRRRIALIREMESYGWRGRRGVKGHVIMRAPDGETTTSVSQKVISPKNDHDVARDFRRWLRQQQEVQARMTFPGSDAVSVLAAMLTLHEPAPVAAPPVEVSSPAPAPAPPEEIAPEPVDTAPEPMPCGLCEKPFASLQALSVHRVRAHSKVVCEICDEPMSPTNLPRHTRRHVEDMGTHTETMREILRLRAEIARLRNESVEWERMADEIEDRYTAVKSRLDNAVGYLIGD